MNPFINSLYKYFEVPKMPCPSISDALPFMPASPVALKDFFNGEITYFAKPDKLVTVKDGLIHQCLPFGLFCETRCDQKNVWLLNGEVRILCVHLPSKYIVHGGDGFRTYERAFHFLENITPLHAWNEVTDLLNCLHHHDLKLNIARAYLVASGEEMSV